MPVADIPVHPLTVDKGRWGCYNRPDFKPWYFGQREVMIFPVVGKMLSFIGLARLMKIKHVNTMECVTGRNGGEAKCHDCFRRAIKKDSE